VPLVRAVLLVMELLVTMEMPVTRMCCADDLDAASLELMLSL
jgi:hypothetical protein